MVTEALTGGLAGGVLRMAPELFRFLDRRADRRHELALQELEFKFTQKLGHVRGGENIVPFISEGALSAMRESYIQEAGAASRKRFPWVDALVSLVRPGVTYSLLGLYVFVRIVTRTYTEADVQLFSSVLMFWFIGRAWERAK